eukprot:6487075-Amphidinium_carterae.2
MSSKASQWLKIGYTTLSVWFALLLRETKEDISFLSDSDPSGEGMTRMNLLQELESPYTAAAPAHHALAGIAANYPKQLAAANKRGAFSVCVADNAEWATGCIDCFTCADVSGMELRMSSTNPVSVKEKLIRSETHVVHFGTHALRGQPQEAVRRALHPNEIK